MTRWILECESVFRAGMENFSARVYTFACLRSWEPVSSRGGVVGSGWRVPVGSLCGKYSPV